ncbi:DUF502 domain-containing protein [Anatilimnocola sp. NA78]|uniref:DUF502 domain-containing protein n=1 Tax=Anatilimnocola sp. NA78 TaxID=3415683 RepID=UPI003CE5A28E
MNEVSPPSRHSSAVAMTEVAPPLANAPQGFKARIFGGLIMVLPILITLWVMGWLFFALQSYVIDPLAFLVLWAVRKGRPATELPEWFEIYAAPPIALLLALLLLYVLGFFVHSRLRRSIDAILLRVPILSTVYDGVQKIFKTLDKQRENSGTQRVVLVEFPHPGMKVPGFVTATCRDIDTQKTLLCIYVPTTPVPTSGYFLLVPEEDVVELNWTSEQTIQTIVSGGLTVPPEVRFYKSAQPKPAPAQLAKTE